MEKIVDEIIEILEYLNTKQMKKLREENYDMYRQHIYTKFENFEYFSILKILIDNDDVGIEKLTDMIRMVENIREGKIKFTEANEIIKEKRANEFIYPKFGGKEEMIKQNEKIRKNEELLKKNT